MILDTMTYSIMAVAAILSLIVILLAWFPQGQQNKNGKQCIELIAYNHLQSEINKLYQLADISGVQRTMQS